MTLITFSKGPSLRVHLQFLQDALMRVTLSHAAQFECEIPSGFAEADPYLKWLESYGKKERCAAPLELDLLTIPPFQRSVLEALMDMESGQVMSYQQMAVSLGNPRACRAVGNACNRNPFPLFIPCHRIISSGSKGGGFAYGMEMKLKLLNFEATVRENDA